MRNAYALLGLLFLIVIIGTALLVSRNSKETNTMANLSLKSSAFEENGKIPSKYTCDIDNVSPPLSISGVPEGTKTLALIMDDPDIPDSVKQSMGIDTFDHWVLFNLPPTTTTIEEGSEPEGTLGNNSSGKPGYTGPCPPDREHRYFFKLYALDDELSLLKGSSKADVESAMEGHILEKTELLGRYERQK